MSNKDFLPNDYSVPASGGNYMRLQDGANRFRVMSQHPIIGYEWWVEEGGNRKPKRVRTINEVPAFVRNADDNRKREKHFWAFVVWNYADESLQILEITQVTIMRLMEKFIKDVDYGSPVGYDIEITKEGQNVDTKYYLIAKPPKPVAKEIQAEFDASSINLEALYEGGDPFAVNNSTDVEGTL